MANGTQTMTRGGGSASGTLRIGDDVMEFDGTLKYGGNDPVLSAAERATVTPWEEKRSKNKIEYALATWPDGSLVSNEKKGGTGSIWTPHSWQSIPGGTFTHTHPREPGQLGGTFSPQDIKNFSHNDVETFRAAAKEGTYSISKKQNFHAAGFLQYFNDAHKAARQAYKARADKLLNDYMNDIITRDEYNRQYDKLFNTYLVQQHNALLRGQKQYGYSYTLEKR